MRGCAPAQSRGPDRRPEDRKSTRLNSSHLGISYAVFCLKKKIPHHGNKFILELVRFQPSATKAFQYLNANGAFTYTDNAGDSVSFGNLPQHDRYMTVVRS